MKNIQSHLNLSSNEKLTLLSNLSTLLSAGIPILEAVDSLLEDGSKNMKKILSELKQDLTQGQKISSTFAKFPNVFDPVMVNLIKASEESGTLDTSLKDITEHYQKEIEFSEKIKTACVYPAFVIIVFSGVLFVILTFVIPRIAQVFTRMRVDLPISTQILIVISNFVTAYKYQVLIAAAFLVILTVFIYRYNKKLVVNSLLSLPLLSTLGKEIDLARFNRSMSLLLKSGIPITEALDLSEHVVSRPEITKIIKNIQKIVDSGRHMSDGFKESKGVIPSMMVRITEAGEKSGTLETAFQDLSDHFEIKVSNTLKKITVLFEPISIVFIGLLVGGMMLSVIAPIYQLIGNLQGR